MNQFELAWAAGIFEGEGSVRINKNTQKNLGALLCDMVNVQPEITEFFAQHWGGYHRQVAVQPPRRSYWRWRIASLQAARFMADLNPYLRTAVYRERFAVGLAYQAQKMTSRSNRTPEYHARQLEFYERMRALNLRGAR